MPTAHLLIARITPSLPHRYLWLVALLASVACGDSRDCESFIQASIADMRGARGSGCFELQQVVVVARAPSTVAPRVYVQDPGGGALSAIMAKCDGTSSHACASGVGDTVHSAIDGDAVTVRGYYQQGSVTGFEELYISEFTREGSLLPRPAPVSLDVSEVTRSARTRSKWFQIGTVSVTDPWVIYDFSPAELTRSGACAGGGGFGMIPRSAGTTIARGCTMTGDAGTSPAGLESPDPGEILVGREFYEGFYDRTDCSCAGGQASHLLCPEATLSGTVGGILTLEIVHGTTRAYQLFQPLSKALFPISRTFPCAAPQ